MNSSRRSQKTVRTAVLLVSSLAMVALMFAIYQHSQDDGPSKSTVRSEDTVRPRSEQPEKASRSPVAAPAPSPVSSATPAPGVADTGKPRANLKFGSERIPIRGGEHATLTLYGPRGRPRGQLVVKEWKPVGDGGNEIEVIEPELRLRTPGGQRVKITATSGRIALDTGKGRTPDPTSGRLIGDVRIVVDRLTEEERAALPEEQRDKLDDYRRIDLHLDDILFDLEFSRLESEGNFSIRAAEAVIEGAGLSVRYNELDSRIDDLVIRAGKRIEVRGSAARFAVRLDSKIGPPKTRMPAIVEAPKATPEPEVTTSAPPAEQDDLPILPTDEPQEKKVRPTDTYTAVFEREVSVTQFAGETRVGQLKADLLEILFDFGQQERDLARKPPAPSEKPATASDEDRDSKTTTTAPASDAEPEQRIVVEWSGPLTVRCAPRDEQTAPTSDGQRRLHVTASGEPVVFDDPSRHMRCRRFVYHDETGHVQLFGTPDTPASVSSDEMGQLTATEMALNRSGQTASAKGPGRLVSYRAPAAGLVPGSTGSGDEAGASGSGLDISFADELSASFTQVVLAGTDPDTGLATETTKQVLEHAVFSGSVVMLHQEQRIACDRIDVDFKLDQRGKPFPSRAEAIGNVRASQGDRYITAKNRMIVDVAMTGGESDSDKDGQPALRRVRAYGQVEVRDPRQELELDAHSLDCVFDAQQKIEHGVVAASGGGTAFVGFGDFSVASPKSIRFHVPHQEIEVAGGGRMTFPSEQGLDGSILDEPVLVSVNWARRMGFSGQDNNAVFRGDVHAETPDSSFECADLRIEFADVEPESQDPTAAQEPDWWIFAPLAQRVTGDTKGDGFLAGSNFRKRPTELYATGGIVALTRVLDETTHRLRSRVRIGGPTAVVNLVEGSMRIEGAGTLLIEDYRPASTDKNKDTASDPRPRTSPFGKRSSGEPSQTFVAWQRSMTYDWERAIARFDNDIQVSHRTGAKMLLARRILIGREEELRRGSGRQATLTCDTLTIQFTRDSAAGKSSAGNLGTGRLSGNEVEAFNAAGRVYFKDSGVSVIAQTINYNRDDATLVILGTEGAPAQLFDQRNRFTNLTGPKFYWNRQTNQIRAPKARGTRR